MRLFPCLAAAALLIPGAASASSMVIGSGLARMCFEAADAERATPGTLDACNRALADEPLSFDDQVATYVNRGIIRARMSDFAGALSDYDRAIRLDPGQAEAYLNKGALVLKVQHDWRQARDLFDAALDRHTRRPEIAYFGRAISNELAGDLAGAMADYQKASDLAPNWDEPKKELTRFSVRKRG
ncbi:tetratricopeptide repeat protein [Sphingomonas sp. MAH-20]|jgi:tetratricopeptide (TPR) repeat protein|uniref:Tetratricopeptide repeat protein n=1 Tax=Sphingomonas horti TaxID=2682842 RepID=A0A6I4J0L2_9SPHN|nr:MULTISPECIES: tetratricopeptide repeat protein [Sphingomonas]MBA2919850.1 tetratricopeptide repeat protein [Sphingomonas sp. CGMCC 1.13658]MVO78089.1 tetratricopeptide repeat protein [Sphingomonas horti]